VSDVEIGAEYRAKTYGQRSLPGDLTTARRRRLVTLFAEDPDAGAVDVYSAWHGEDPLETADDASRSANALAAGGTQPGSSFDPVEDAAHNTTRTAVKRAYDDALDAGLEDEAAYLRALPHEHQQAFATLLEQEYVGQAT